MFRHYNAAFQTWRTVNMYRSMILCSSNTIRQNYNEKLTTNFLPKNKENVKLLTYSFTIKYSTSTSKPNIKFEKLEKFSSVGQFSVTKYKLQKLIIDLGKAENKSEKGLELLKLCRNAERINVEFKKKFIDETWSILAESRQATEEHCQEYLLCNLDYRSVVPPHFILSDLIKCNIFINYRILQLLLQCSCNHGMLSHIDFIISTMNEMKFPVTEEVQRTLMIGKAKAGEMDEALKIFKELESLEGVATCETYVAFLKAVACIGDQKRLHDYHNEAVQYGIEFTEEDILSILEYLIFNYHFDLVPEVLEWKSDFHGENCKKFLLKLTSQNYSEIAVVLLPAMSNMENDDIFVNDFLKRLIQASIPFDDVISVCNLLTEKKVSDHVLLSATHFFLLNRNIDEALKMFQILLDNGFPLRIHYFWPLIIASYKKDSVDGVFKILKEMKKFKMEFDETTMLNIILPRLKNLESQFIFTKICDTTGWISSDVFQSVATFFSEEKQFHKLYNLIADYKDIDKKMSPLVLANNFARNTSSTNIGILMEIISLLPPTFVSLYVTQLSRIIIDIPLFIATLKSLHKNGFAISRDNYHFIVDSILKKRTRFSFLKLDEITPTLLNLVNSSAPEKSFHMENLPDVVHIQNKIGKSRTKEYFEDLLSEKERKNEDLSFVLCNLLSIYVQSKNYEKATEIKNKIKQLNLKLTPGIKSKLLGLSIEKKDLPSSVLYYKEIVAENPTFEIDCFKIIKLVSLLIENGLVDQTVEILKVAPINKSNPSYLHNRVQELLQNLAKCRSTALYQHFVEILKELNYLVIDSKSFYPLMELLLKKNEVKDACKLFAYCVKKHNIAPCPLQLISRVIEECEGEVLQKILQIYSTACSYLEVRTITSFAYASTGRIVELKNYIKENPVTFLTNNTYATKMIEFCAKKGKSTELETLFFSLYPSKEAEKLIPHIFKSFDFNEDRDRPLKFLERITENNIRFPATYGKYLASVISLKKET